jgi:hypothetical protein
MILYFACTSSSSMALRVELGTLFLNGDSAVSRGRDMVWGLVVEVKACNLLVSLSGVG